MEIIGSDRHVEALHANGVEPLHLVEDRGGQVRDRDEAEFEERLLHSGRMRVDVDFDVVHSPFLTRAAHQLFEEKANRALVGRNELEDSYRVIEAGIVRVAHGPHEVSVPSREEIGGVVCLEGSKPEMEPRPAEDFGILHTATLESQQGRVAAGVHFFDLEILVESVRG